MKTLKHHRRRLYESSGRMGAIEKAVGRSLRDSGFLVRRISTKKSEGSIGVIQLAVSAGLSRSMDGDIDFYIDDAVHIVYDALKSAGYSSGDIACSDERYNGLKEFTLEFMVSDKDLFKEETKEIMDMGKYLVRELNKLERCEIAETEIYTDGIGHVTLEILARTEIGYDEADECISRIMDSGVLGSNGTLGDFTAELYDGKPGTLVIAIIFG